MDFVWESFRWTFGDPKWQSNFPVHAYTVYVSVQSTLRSPFLYGLRMRKFYVTIYRPKMASRPFRTCSGVPSPTCARGKLQNCAPMILRILSFSKSFSIYTHEKLTSTFFTTSHFLSNPHCMNYWNYELLNSIHLNTILKDSSHNLWNFSRFCVENHQKLAKTHKRQLKCS